MHLRFRARALVAFALVLAASLLMNACGGRTPPATNPAPAPAVAPVPAAVSTSPAPAVAPVPATASTSPTPAAAPVPAATPRPPSPPPLVGHVTRAAVEDYETWKTLRAEDYTPDAAAVKTIADRAGDVKVLLILATWCPDSKREVPRFFKILDQARVSLDRVTMVGVDRTKKDAEGLTVKHDIQRVPTFVFFRGDREIGRVIERATTTLENDIAQIVNK